MKLKNCLIALCRSILAKEGLCEFFVSGEADEWIKGYEITEGDSS